MHTSCICALQCNVNCVHGTTLPHHAVHRLKDNELDKEGQELADALHAGTGRLAGFLNQSVGTPSDTHFWKSCVLTHSRACHAAVLLVSKPCLDHMSAVLYSCTADGCAC